SVAGGRSRRQERIFRSPASCLLLPASCFLLVLTLYSCWNLILKQRGQQSLLKVFGSVILFIAPARLNGPSLPLRTLTQQTTDRVRQLVLVIRICRQACFRWVNNFASSIQRADKTGTPYSHSLKIDQAKPFAAAGHQQTTTVLQ